MEKMIVCCKVQHNHVLNLTFFSIPLDRPQETSVSLALPKVFVKGSAKSFVTVLGEPKDMLAYVHNVHWFLYKYLYFKYSVISKIALIV